MPKPKSQPKYRHQKARGLAVVRIDGKDHYLGRYDSPESWEMYHRLLAERASNPSRPVAPHPATGPIVASKMPTVAELALAYSRHCDEHYRRADGSFSAEHQHIRLAVRGARKVHGSTPADRFGPIALKAVRQSMIDAGLARVTINQRVCRVVRMFRWATEAELIPPTIYQALEAVEGLKKGRTTAPEPRKVRPVADDLVDACRPFLTPQVWAIVELLRLTGARAGEIAPMRTADVDRSGDLWVYRPRSHKTEGHGIDRAIVLGPRAVEVLKPWLRADPEAHLFQPREAVQVLRERARERRASPVQPSQRCRKKAKPKRQPGEVYDVRAVYKAIRTACRRAFPHPRIDTMPVESLSAEDRVTLRAWRKANRWHPHQLRHSLATTIRARFGLEASQVVLGHSRADTTQIYAEKNLARAGEVMREIGSNRGALAHDPRSVAEP